IQGERKATRFVQAGGYERHGSFSPDGRFVAYTSNQSGRPEIYVRAFPSGAGPWQISNAGGDQASWRGDGGELFFISPEQDMMAARVSIAGGNLSADPARPLFRVRIQPPTLNGSRNDYVVAADGQHFLVNELIDDPAKASITVVVNWASRLQ